MLYYEVFSCMTYSDKPRSLVLAGATALLGVLRLSGSFGNRGPYCNVTGM